jgi:DNA polymerase I-like protein with 3'-5' exonuclease and polymerase domains
MDPVILFVTRRNPEKVTLPKISPREARIIAESWARRALFHDIETTGENPHLNEMLLDAWWDGNPLHPVLVLDSLTVKTHEVFTEEDLKDRIIWAHNGGFEKRWLIKRGLRSGLVKCTMVNEQTLLSGCTDFDYDIVSCLKRRGVPIPTWMNKEIREEFVGVDPTTFVLEDKHVLYNATDVTVLPALVTAQQVQIDKYNLNFLIHHLRSPLVSILAEAEMTGFVHDSEYWIRLAEKRKDQANELIGKMNEYVVSHGLDLLSLNPQLKDLYDRNRNRRQRLLDRLVKVNGELERLQEKGRTTTKVFQTHLETRLKITTELQEHVVLPPPSINWASPQQPIEVMKALGISPLPMSQNSKTYQLQVSVNKAARNNWFADNPDHPKKDFMKLFDQYKKVEHNIKSFGIEWINLYTNPITGKVHTCYRQAGTRTGRFASGNKKRGYFNLQQIPGEITEFPDGRKVAEYRACFKTDPGRKMATLDYTGCEVICMVSLSQDLDLKRITELPDQHSYMGTKCWRAVFADRYKRTGDKKWLDLANTYEMSSKGTPKDRKRFKESGIFPVIYGVKPNKVASVQGFAKHEGQIFIETIEQDMPKVVTFVKSKAAFALANGYVIHNTRTNSRRWFRQVIEANRRGETLSSKEAGKVETAARNSPIQGTNVDIIIEAIVTIARWARLFKVDVRLLGQVHDELIYDFPEDQDWIPAKLQELMARAAQRYLIPEISMSAGCDIGYTWIK